MSRFGKSRLFDDDEDDKNSFGYRGNADRRYGGRTAVEEEEEEDEGWGGGRGKSSSSSSSRNPFDDDAPDELLRVQARIAKHEDGCLESTQRALASIADSERVGVATAEELLSQREQLERVDQRLDETQTTLKSSQRSLNTMKSVFGGFANMFRKKETAANPPSPVRSKPFQKSSLGGVVEELDDDGVRPRATTTTTNRGNDVGGFYADDDVTGSRGASRSSTRESMTASDSRNSGLGGKPPSARMAEVDENLDLMSAGLGRLKNLASGLNDEITTQNELLDRINDKVMDTDDTLWHQQKQIKRILK